MQPYLTCIHASMGYYEWKFNSIAAVLQDALYKKYCGLALESKIQATIKELELSYQVLRNHKTGDFINITYLQGVARVRFAIMEIASILHEQFISEKATLSAQQPLMQLAEQVCTDQYINTTDFTEDVVGPAAYLIKLLARQYGFPCLREVSQEHLQWIVPEGLRTKNQVYI